MEKKGSPNKGLNIMVDMLPLVLKEFQEELEKLIYYFNISDIDKVKEVVHKVIGTAKCYDIKEVIEGCEGIFKCFEEGNEELMLAIEKLRQAIMSFKEKISGE